MKYLKRMGSIANLFIMLSKKSYQKYKLLTDLYSSEKKRDGFLRHVHESLHQFPPDLELQFTFKKKLHNGPLGPCEKVSYLGYVVVLT